MKKVEFIFPEFTNIYGESYNLEYLRRCNPEIELVLTEHGDTPAFISGKADMVYFGCMSEEKQQEAIRLLKPYKTALTEEIEGGTVFLSTGNSIEIFGREITGDEVLSDRKIKIEGLGIFDYYSKRSMKAPRYNSQFIGKFDGMTMLGHRSQYSMSYGDFRDSFIEVELGIGMNPNTKQEGVHVNNFFATYSLGPFLILNPYFTKYLFRTLGLEDSLCFEKEVIEAYEYRLSKLRRGFEK